MSVGDMALGVALGIVGGAALLMVIGGLAAHVPDWLETWRYRRQYRRDTGRDPW